MKIGITNTHAVRYLLPAVCAILAAVGGCQRPPLKEAKVDAERQWKQVRARVKLQLAEQQFAAFSFDEAIKTASEALHLDPQQLEAYVLVARAHLELGKPASAEAAIAAAERAGLRSATLIYTKGALHEQRGRFDVALECFAQAFALDPINSEYLVAQSEALIALDRVDEARKLLEESAERVNDEGAVALAAGRVALLQGRDEDAVFRYRQALASQPEDSLLAEDLGILLARTGRFSEAVALLKNNDHVVQNSPAARRALAACHLALNDPAAARALLADYGRVHPTDVGAQLLLAQAAIEEGNVTTATEALNRAEQHHGPRGRILLFRAALSWLQGDLRAARGCLTEAIELGSGDADAHCLMGELLYAQQEPLQAQAHFHRALELDPSNSWARRGLDSGG